jgi:hypothetical protein
MKEKKETLVRINTRIPKEQFVFIKNYAKKNDMGEGEVHRMILDRFMIDYSRKFDK